LVLAPIIIRSLRRVRLPGKRAIVVGLSAMALAYIFTVLEGYYAPEVFNTLEHAMYATSGLAFLASAIGASRYWYGQGGGER
jgi:hypothetical protein